MTDTIGPYVGYRFDWRSGYLRVSRSKTARKRAEMNRRRRDKKTGRYGQFLVFVNRTYGRHSEWEEVADAWSRTVAQGGTMLDFVETLAINEAIDRVYGARALLLREEVYSRHWYRLPIGIDALSNFWRHL